MVVPVVSRIRKAWRRASLIQRLVLVTLVPSAVSTILLAVLLSSQQYWAIQKGIRDTASNFVTHMADMARDPLEQHDQDDLRRIVNALGTMPYVGQVRILDARGKVLALASRTLPPDAPTIRLVENIHSRDHPGRVLGAIQVDLDTRIAPLSQYTTLFDTLLWLGVAIVLAIVLSWQQARWISAPLRRLSLAMGHLGHSTPEPVEVTDESEIGDLQRGFNAAATTLYALHRDMERRIEQATQELARKNEALEQASRAKARFLAGATHDLRQPLYALTLFSSSLGEGETDPARLDRIARVQQCVESLDRLFGELLDLSRLETGAMKPEWSDFPVDEIFQEVSRNFRIQAEKKELRLITRTTPLWVRSDRTMLARILNNLVSNALRYTAEGGVLVCARHRGDLIRIDVWDTGLGIANEHQAHIFDEFFRIDPHTDRAGGELAVSGSQHGLGLGLSTVKRLAELLDIPCTLRSTPGRGTLFSLMIPASEQHVIRRERRQRGWTGAVESARELLGKQILVIDDDQAILAGMQDLLHRWGCLVHVAPDAASALAQARRLPRAPDLVITDLHLGHGTNGVKLLDDLYELFAADSETIPFARLLITGETDRDRLQDALAAGITILFKPIPPRPLREVIVALLQGKRVPFCSRKDDPSPFDNTQSPAPG